MGFFQNQDFQSGIHGGRIDGAEKSCGASPYYYQFLMLHELVWFGKLFFQPKLKAFALAPEKISGMIPQLAGNILMV